MSAPVSTAHDFNHSLAPSVEDPHLQGMLEPSLYGLQTQSTIGGDHCFSGSTSSTVPFLPGTPGFLPQWWDCLCMDCKRRVQFRASRNPVVLSWPQSPTRQESWDMFPSMECKVLYYPACRVDVQLQVNTHKIRTVLATNLGQVHNRQYFDIYKFLMVIV